MTIARVLMAAALIVLGFMIWGVHKDIYSLTELAQKGGAQIMAKLDASDAKTEGATAKINDANAKLDKMYNLTRGTGTVGRPKAKPIKHLVLPPKPAPKPKPQPGFWDRMFQR